MSGSFLATLAEQRSCADCVLKPMCRPAIVRPDEMETLAALVLPRRQIAAGGSLYEQGSPVRAFFVSQGGVLKTQTVGADGQTQVIGFHFPGELMGLEALHRGHFRSSAIAVESSTICEIPVAALERIASRDAVFQQQLMRAMGTCFARQQDHLELLAMRQADERIAIFLFGLLNRSEAASGQVESLIHLPMSRSDIGNYLCLTTETVSRGFSRLRDDGILGVNGRHLRILDRKRLMARARTPAGSSMRQA